MEQVLDIYGCYGFYGAHIALCIKDFAIAHNHLEGVKRLYKRASTPSKKERLKNILYNYYTARDYLFGGLLEESIDKFGLPLDAQAVKDRAKNLAKHGYNDDRIDLPNRRMIWEEACNE